MACDPTNYPNGIDAGACLQVDTDALVLIPDTAVEVTGDYTQRIQDDIIWCDGVLEVTMLDPTLAIKKIDIRSLNGTVTLTPTTGTVETASLTTGTSQTLGPRATGWFDL